MQCQTDGLTYCFSEDGCQASWAPSTLSADLSVAGGCKGSLAALWQPPACGGAGRPSSPQALGLRGEDEQ